MSVSTMRSLRIYACTTSTAFTLAPCWHQIRMHHINSLHFCAFASAFNNCIPTLPPLPLYSCPLILTQPPTSFTTCCLFFFFGFAFSSLDVHCRNKITGHGGTWHFRLEKAQMLSSHACPISIRKELSWGRRSSKWRSQAGNFQASQAGTGKHAQAGHWQTFPGRELAKRPRQGLQNVPRQGTGKHSQAGNWQASQAGTANVPRQGTGKCSQ